ncbi:MAG: FecR domain-containing protein [Myxococcales bacterium]|nr:FecR domain-containing protein [Myxococcales bacterium]
MTLDPRDYRRATTPEPTEVDALVDAVALRLDEEPSRRSWTVWVPALAAAAAALAFLAWPASRGPLTLDLRSVAETHLEGGDWELVHRGEGHLDAVGDEVDVDWERGRLVVEVRPGAGLDLRVHTPEALVEVVGTGFVVERDAVGTLVEVVHGVVRTTCEGEVVELRAGESRRCWPLTAGGRLERARVLREQGAEADAVLALVDAGAASEPGPAVAAELAALGVDVAYAAGRWEDVLVRGEPWLDVEGPRRLEITERVALARVRLSGCSSAGPLLHRLAEERGTPPDLERALRCPR